MSLAQAVKNFFLSPHSNVDRLRALAIIFFFAIGGIPALLTGAVVWFASDIYEVVRKYNDPKISPWAARLGIFGLVGAVAGLAMLAIVSWFFPPFALIGMLTLGGAAVWISLTMGIFGSKSSAETIAHVATALMLIGIFLTLSIALFAAVPSGFGFLATAIVLLGIAVYTGANLKAAAQEPVFFERWKGVTGYLTMACILLALFTSFFPPISIALYSLVAPLAIAYVVLALMSPPPVVKADPLKGSDLAPTPSHGARRDDSAHEVAPTVVARHNVSASPQGKSEEVPLPAQEDGQPPVVYNV